jgi:hypothetical protein
MSRKKRRGLQGQKWLTTSLSESVLSLTATVTALELDAQSLPATSDGFDIANDEDSLGDEHIADNEDSLTTDEEFEYEEAPVDDSTTVAQQAEMHFGRSNNTKEVSDNNNNNSKDANNVILSPSGLCNTRCLQTLPRRRGKPRVLRHPFCLTSKPLFQKQSGHHQASQTRYLSQKPQSPGFLTNPYYLSGWQLTGPTF